MSNKKEEENKLDLQIRSLMENAEEPVPEHLWTAISDRLDAAGALAGKRMVVPVWFKRAAIGLAAAAAVALGAFLFVPRHHATEDERVAVVSPSEENDANPADEGQETANLTSRTAEDSEPSTQDNVSTTTQSSKDNITSAESEPSIASQLASAPSYIAQTLETPGEEALDENDQNTSETDLADESPVAELSESALSSSSETDLADESGTDQLEDMSSWSGEQFEEGQAAEGRRKVRTAIVMSGNAMANGSTTSSSSSGLNRQLSSSIVQQTTPGIDETSKSSFSIPASFGLGVKIIFTPRWSLGVGLNYSILSRTFSGIYTSYSADTDSYSTTSYSKIRHNVSYIGIPVNAYFSIVSSHAVDFYAYAGGTVEKAVGNKYLLEDDGFYKERVKGVQCSADLGIGVEFTIVDMVGLYIDPSIRYYFPNSHQPTSIRTQEPFTFGFEIGFRIRL